MSIIIKDLSYTHTDKEVLFSNLNLIINSGEKTALTGNNGCGKSTLMRILAGEASPGTGSVHCSGHLYYVPQHFGQYDDRTVAQVLGIDHKLTALHAILNGDTAEEHFARLDNDWNIEERTQAVLHAWHLNGISLLRPLEGLSGGEKTRLFLAGMERTPYCWTNRPIIWILPGGNVCMISYTALRLRCSLSVTTVLC